MNGYIKIHRKFLKWEWYKNINTKIVFIHCLLQANWEDTKFEGKVIPRGSFIMGRKKMAKELGITEQSVRTALEHLKATNEITIKATNKYSVVTVVNYDFYQQNDKQPTNNLTNNSTNEQPTNNQQTTTIKEYKEYKEEKENNIYAQNEVLFDRFWSAYPKKQSKVNAKKWFKKNKPSEELVGVMLEKLEQFKQTKQWKENNGQFIPYPSTWLSQKRWEDEIIEKNKPERKYL